MSAITGLVIVVTVLANQDLQSTLLSGGIVNGGALIAAVFDSIPLIGDWLLIASVSIFALLTLIGWSYYGNRCAHYIFGSKVTKPFNVIYLAIIFIGAISVSELVWHVSDLLNVFMMVPNLIMVLLLSGMISRETKHYVYGNRLNQTDRSSLPVTDR
jgi:AGCS family alanine or glycine:cation symporter